MSTGDHLPRLVFSIGDCNGIGPEVLLKGLTKTLDIIKFSPIIVGNLRLIAETIDALSLSTARIDNSDLSINSHQVPVLNLPVNELLAFGSLSAEIGRLAGESITRGVEMLLRDEAEGLVTMPISKSGLNLGGFNWLGHTEMITHLSGGNAPLMILATETLRVALTTSHLPLQDVPSLITSDLIQEKFIAFHKSLREDFGIASPRIALLGLNPHAGEDGILGWEEKKIFVPTINNLCSNGYLAEGPFPADGFFARYRPGEYDGVLASYHDQGLIPLKMIARGAGVHITAGLPIVRTSPDHGTAYGIAGKGIADETSTVQAIDMALKIINNRRHDR